MIYLLWSTDHRAFWGKDRSGYTLKIDEAGRYPEAEARRICGSNSKRAWSSSPGDVPAEIMVPAPEAMDALKTLLIRYAVRAEMDWPSDSAEFCGWWCHICSRHVYGPDDEHDDSCPLHGTALPEDMEAEHA